MFKGYSRCLFPVLGIHNYGYRSVIYKAHLHHRPEHTGFNFFRKQLFRAGDELVVQRDSGFGPGCPDMGWAVPFFYARMQSELADE